MTVSTTPDNRWPQDRSPTRITRAAAASGVDQRFAQALTCTGEARESALGLAPQGRDAYTATLGWYLLEHR